MTSYTFAFTGTTSVLRSDFLPEIRLDPDSDYCCGLLDFTSYNSIPNIIENKNNEFTFEYKVDEKKKDSKGKETINQVTKRKTISLATGAYEVSDILHYLKNELANEKINFTYEISAASSRVKIIFGTTITWTAGSVLDVIGFRRGNSVTFNRNWAYWSSSIVKITDIDVIRVECDIVSGSYINGRHCHTIHQFSHCKVSPGFKFIEVPQHIIYLPITEKRLRNIQISIVDQNGEAVDFRGEQITCRIHIKKVDE